MKKAKIKLSVYKLNKNEVIASMVVFTDMKIRDINNTKEQNTP